MRSTQVKLTLMMILTVSRVAASSDKALSLDLSYQTTLSPEVLQVAIHDAVSSNDNVNDISIDLSFSELGNSGINSLIKSVLSLREGVTLDLMTRMNRLTPMGTSLLLQRLLGETESPKNESDDESTELLHGPVCCLRSLDLSWNNLHRDEPGAKAMMFDLRKLVENPSRCPQELRLNRCSLDPAVCRSIGKGIINRYKDDTSDATALSLYLCGNGDVGDAGAAALAAAIRGAKTETTIFSTLDLSACNVGDAGAEALALALESHPGCIENLILSNNKISNSGVASIARGIIEAKAKIERLELDNNPGIGNTGANSLAIAVGKGCIRNLSLRSCEVKADGAKAFGECLKTLALLQGSAEISIDLSGNPLGILQKKKKESLKNKATATTASYMNFISKQIKSGLKDVGLDTVLGTNSVESDDEEEERMGEGSGNDSGDEPVRCGAKAFASAIVLSEEERHHDQPASIDSVKVKCVLGLRHCFLDQGAGDALAATIMQAKTRYGIDLEIDVTLNNVLEDDMVRALSGEVQDGLEDMVDRHMETVEAIRISEQRAAQASRAAAGRRRQWDDDDEYGVVDYKDHYSSEGEREVDDEDTFY